MAEAIVSSDTFSCPICLGLLKCPVTIVCGHSYCMDCINQAWDEEDQRGIYSCPECRETFASRPIISKNVMLADVIKMLNQSGVVNVRSPSTPRGNLKCFDCTGNEPKATVSCLACQVSFCESHYALHETQHSRHYHDDELVRSNDKLYDDDNDYCCCYWYFVINCNTTIYYQS